MEDAKNKYLLLPTHSSIQVSGTSDLSEGTIECFYRTFAQRLRRRLPGLAGKPTPLELRALSDSCTEPSFA